MRMTLFLRRCPSDWFRSCGDFVATEIEVAVSLNCPQGRANRGRGGTCYPWATPEKKYVRVRPCIHLSSDPSPLISAHILLYHVYTRLPDPTGVYFAPTPPVISLSAATSTFVCRNLDCASRCSICNNYVKLRPIGFTPSRANLVAGVDCDLRFASRESRPRRRRSVRLSDHA